MGWSQAVRGRQGWAHWGLWAESHFCVFSASSGCCFPWVVTPSSIFKGHHFNLDLCCHVTSTSVVKSTAASLLQGHLWWHLRPTWVVQDNHICKVPFCCMRWHRLQGLKPAYLEAGVAIIHPTPLSTEKTGALYNFFFLVNFLYVWNYRKIKCF